MSMMRGRSPQQMAAMWSRLKGADKSRQWKYLTKPVQNIMRKEVVYPRTSGQRKIFDRYLQRGFVHKPGSRQLRRMYEHRQATATMAKDAKQRARVFAPYPNNEQVLARYTGLMNTNIERRLSRVNTSGQRKLAGRDVASLAHMKPKQMVPLQRKVQTVQQKYANVLHRIRTKKK